jgi:hypothetical protein
VLRAFALYQPAIGYCQSMNSIAGLLLLVLGASEEQEAFWILAVLEQTASDPTCKVRLVTERPRRGS